MRTQPSNPTVLFLEILARLGIDPRTLTTSPTYRNGRLVVGHSEATLGKLWEFFRIVDVVAAITANLNSGRVKRGKRALPFAGLDVSAGNGAYPCPVANGGFEPVVGTSLQLLDAVVRHRLQYQLALIDKNTDVLRQLETHLSTACAHLQIYPGRVRVLNGDVGEVAVPWIEQHVRPWMPGLMVIDLNEVFDDRALLAIGERPELNHVDVALHLPAAMGKWPRRREPQATLDEVRAAFHKEFWQLPPGRGNFQWTWLYGTKNPRMRVLKERGFVDAASADGLDRLDRLRTTKKERARRQQMEMQFDG
jgi:hypothetical protein